MGTGNNLKLSQSVTPRELAVPEVPSNRAEGKVSNKGEVVRVFYLLRLSESNFREKTRLYAGISVYLELRMLKYNNMRKKTSSADNQQGSAMRSPNLRSKFGVKHPSETTRRAPLKKAMRTSFSSLPSLSLCESSVDGDIVHAL